MNNPYSKEEQERLNDLIGDACQAEEEFDYFELEEFARKFWEPPESKLNETASVSAKEIYNPSKEIFDKKNFDF